MILKSEIIKTKKIALMKALKVVYLNNIYSAVVLILIKKCLEMCPKNKILLTLMFVFLYANCVLSQTYLSGRLRGYDDGFVKIIGVSGDQNYIVDSFEIKKEFFSYKKKESLREGFYFLLLPDYKNLQLLVDKSPSIIFKTSKETLIQSMTFENNMSNTLLYDGLRVQFAIDSIQQQIKSAGNDELRKKELNDLLSSYNLKRTAHLEYCKANYPEEFYTIFKSAGQNPQISEIRKMDGTIDTLKQLAQYRIDFWQNVNLADERLLYTPVLINKLRRYITELTPQQPDSIIRSADYIIQKSMVNDKVFQFFTNWIAVYYQPTKTNIMDGEAVYVHVIDTYFNEKTSHWFGPGELEKLKKKTSEMRASLVGKKGPDVIAMDQDGNQKSIYGITAPYVVVYMFSPNCEHCIKETPKLKTFYNEWKSKGVEVFTIGLETNTEEWKKYLSKNGMHEWTNVFDPTNRAIYAKYYVDITPEIYVLNPDRVIVGKNLKTDQISLIIDRDRARRKQ